MELFEIKKIKLQKSAVSVDADRRTGPKSKIGRRTTE